jgi:hypothetical protein
MIPPDPRGDWILRQARRRPGAERAAFLDGACAGDSVLRERLEKLLAADKPPETVLATQAEAARPTIKLEFSGAPEMFEFLSFSPDQRFLLAMNQAGLPHLWFAPSWEEITAAEAKEKAESHQP